MLISEFDYHLPPELIAQEPLPRRSSSRLMVLDRRSGMVGHRRFEDLPGLLREGDLLVLNDARVFPARLVGRKPTGGRVEVLLTTRLGDRGRPASEQVWEALLGGSRPPGPGGRVEVASDLEVEVLEAPAGSQPARVLLRAEGSVDRAVDRRGKVPLPPYIRRAPDDPREDLDRERYQTVYARGRSAAAAPTAGLHFTGEILEAIRAQGILTAFLTLDVGLGTFRPVSTERVEDHVMHPERYDLSEATVAAVQETRQNGGRVVAVGTTVVRTLEHAAVGGELRPGKGWCDLFITPGHHFRVVDALVSNFHLPRSTLLVLLAALAGRERVLAAYAEAVDRGYRFYSYGDAMLVMEEA